MEIAKPFELFFFLGNGVLEKRFFIIIIIIIVIIINKLQAAL